MNRMKQAMEREISKEQKNKLDQLFSALEVISEGSYIYLCDLKKDYSRWSAEAIEYFGLSGEYMYHAGDIWEEHIHPEDQKSYHESIQDIFSGRGKGHDMQYRARNRMGMYVVCTCRGTVILDEQGEPEYFAGSIRNNGLVNNFDTLTGFQNQYGLFEHLKMMYRNQVKASIMMIGIGHFSTVNEMWGYDFGNIVIHKLVQLLKEEFRNEGALYRTDGVRFVLLSHTLSAEELSTRYEKLKKTITEKLEVDGYHPSLLVYGSALEIRNFSVNPQSMFSCLGYAYNLSKESGNGEFQIFRDEIDEKRHDLLDMLNAVRKSIKKNFQGFVLYYQPVVDASSQKITGCEALLRWQSPEYGMVAPNQFIPIIENDPAFALLGEWILRKAMADMKTLPDWNPGYMLNVNVAYEQLRQDSFVEMVKKCLADTAYPPQNLCLEITERCRLVNLNRLLSILNELRAIGVRVALDDFGTGYSSMNILKKLKCDAVKIDKVFVDSVTEGSQHIKLISIMNELAVVCGSKVCAEGVETKEQCEIIRDCGVDSMQGYYFARPMPLDELCLK